MVEKELCIRCGKPTPYHPNTPITLRCYFVEGSGQLCEQCYFTLYPVPTSFDSRLSAEERPTEQKDNIPNKS